jgi:hypothetical protein
MILGKYRFADRIEVSPLGLKIAYSTVEVIGRLILIFGCSKYSKFTA